MIKLFFAIVFSLFSTYAQNRIEELNIIEGRWKLNDDKNVFIEEWTKIGEIFEGISYLVKDSMKNISERLNILKLHDHILYIAQPGENSPTLFTLISSENNKFVFENKEHDFPQRVVYHFISENLLNASIEGEINSETKRREFFFTKVIE